ncbi:MAG: nitrilase [Rhodobacteraceae bacterium]|nr:nitrilase [Paracoccaceae bacterium]
MALAADLRICLCQPRSAAGSADHALGTLVQGLAVARAAGADVAVFPELLFPGYNAPDVAALAQPLDGPWMAAARDAVREAGLVCAFGLAEREGARVFNSAAAVSADGSIAAIYRKIQLYGAREARIFTPGDAYATFDLKGRKAGLLVCYDVEFAPHVAALAAAGADIILVPTANMVPFTHVSRLTVPSQAVNHGVAIVYANYAGAEGDLTYCGESLVANADGTVVARAGAGEAMLVADLPAPDPALMSTQAHDLRMPGRGLPA